MDCVTVIVKRVYIEVNPLGKSLIEFYGETTMLRSENGVMEKFKEMLERMNIVNKYELLARRSSYVDC